MNVYVRRMCAHIADVGLRAIVFGALSHSDIRYPSVRTDLRYTI